MFILLYHSSLSSSLLFFSSSLSFVILFFVQSLFFRNSSLLFLSSSHIFILPYRRVIVLLLLSSFLSLCYLHPYRSYRPFSFLYRFLYVSSSLVSPFPPLFEDEQKDRGGVGMRMAKKGKKATKKEK